MVALEPILFLKVVIMMSYKQALNSYEFSTLYQRRLDSKFREKMLILWNVLTQQASFAMTFCVQAVAPCISLV